MNLKVLTTVLILSLLLNDLLYAQSLEYKIDSMLFEVFNKDDGEGPGGTFLVAKNGKTIYKKAFGLANVELGVAMSPENVFQIGSMTKQFTAIAILMLEEQGKLSLTDDITTYIADYPTNGSTITLHHLLTHTSGIRDFTKMSGISTIAKEELSSKELVDFFKDEPMDFDPGEKFVYNNSGYVLLGYIIELVSGESYEAFIENNIFEKLGMSDSRYAHYREIVYNRAYGYHNRGELTNKIFINNNIPYASGALMSTVEDMLRWQNAIDNDVLLNPSSLKKAFSNYSLNNGEHINYGFGWHIVERDGIKMREHGGSIFGFKSMGVYIPEKNIYVIGFTNCDCLSPTRVAREIARLTYDSL